MGFIFCWLYFPKEYRKYYLLLPVAFYLFWLANYHFSFTDLYYGHLALGKTDAISIFLQNAKWAVLSVFFAYKFLWILVLLGWYYYFQNKDYMPLFQTATMVVAPLALVVVPDASRVVAWGSIGVFMAVAYASKYVRDRLFNLILILNLFLPSVAVGTTTSGPVSFPGLYGFGIFLFKLFVKKYLI